MPTIRSYFTYAQFLEVFQRLAHQIAIKAVTDLKSGDVTIKSHGPRFSEVRTSKCTINFYAAHLNYAEGNYDKGYHFGFDIEDKLYMTSNHSSKVSYWAPDEKLKTAEQDIQAFLDKLMKDVKPVPRFSLTRKRED